jgi:hypothetical protein
VYLAHRGDVSLVLRTKRKRQDCCSIIAPDHDPPRSWLLLRH